MKMTTLTSADIAAMEKLTKVQFVNSFPGQKPICLIGTIDSENRTNLAPFSSVIHLGSDPALIGLVSRPDLVDRHTYSNILETKSYTINHVHSGILEQAHHCSAKYDKNTSEFTKTGLTPHFETTVKAPFVAESKFRFSLELAETIPISTNGTILIVGKVTSVQFYPEHLAADGSLDLVAMDSLSSTALDTYFQPSNPIRLPYAKPHNES